MHEELQMSKDALWYINSFFIPSDRTWGQGPDLIFSNEVLKATFPAGLLLSQCNALRVLQHGFPFTQSVEGQKNR